MSLVSILDENDVQTWVGLKHTECPRASSHSFIPTRLGTPLNAWELGAGVDAAVPASVTAVFGRAVRRRDSSSLSAFYS
jgi:hypothetical protein